MSLSLGRRFALASGAISVLVALGVLSWFGSGVESPDLVAALVVAGLAGGLAGYAAAWPVLRSLGRIDHAVHSFAKGEVSARARLRDGDALVKLGQAVDELGIRLQERGVTSEVDEERYRTTFDAMAEAVLVVDARQRVVFGNRRLSELAGGATIGRTASEVVRHPVLHTAIERALEGQGQRVAFELPTAKGGVHYQAQVSELPRGQGAVVVLHDVSKERMADQIRRDFVANASHELRTPLTAIRGFAETLRGGARSEEQRVRFTDLILKHTMRLQALVEDLSALSSAESEAQQLALKDVDLGGALRDALSAVGAVIENKKLSVDNAVRASELVARADEHAVQQVVLNLVDNAVKYTPAEGTITIKGRCVDSWVEIEIQNTGPGIPSSKLSRVFERFYRVDPGRSRELGGTGLGLSIVKHQVARLGGEIYAESEPGAWTRFRLRLPPSGHSLPV